MARGGESQPAPRIVLKAIVVTVMGGLAIGAFGSVYHTFRYSNRKGQELPLWYSVPLCETDSPADSSCEGGGCRRFVSVNLDVHSADGQAACTTPLQDEYHSQTVDFPIRSSFFMAGLKYRLYCFRHALSSLAAIDAELLTTKAGQSSPSTVFHVKYRRVDLHPSPPPLSDVDEDPHTYLFQDDDVTAGKRRLLKGGGGGFGGRSTRTRNRYYGVHRRRHRHTSPWGYVGSDAVQASAADPLVVRQFSRAMGTSERGGLLSFVKARVGYPHACVDPDTGCEVELINSLDRDEFADSDFVFSPDDFGHTSVLRVKRLVMDANTYSLAAPEALFTFATEETDDAYTSGEFWLPVSLAILAGSVLLCVCAGPCMLRENGSLRNLRISGTGCRYVTTLKVASNDITSLDGLAAFPSLEHLDLRDNDLNSLNGAIWPTRLQSLDLSSNDLTAMATRWPASLTTLNVANNDLTSVAIQQACNVTTLNAANNDLKTLEGLQHFPNLREIKLQNNDLTDIRALTTAHELRICDLQHNDLEDPQAVTALSMAAPRLEVLRLGNNNFSVEHKQHIVDTFRDRLPDCSVTVN